MEKRAFEGIPVNMKVRFFSGRPLFYGTITNISESGIYIKTAFTVPPKSRVVMFLPLNGETIQIQARVIRIMTTECGDDVIVKMVRPPKKYVEYVKSLNGKKPREETFQISEEILSQTTKCPKNFQCLTNRQTTMCSIDGVIDKYNGLFISKKTRRNCPYLTLFGYYSYICTCPTRREIYIRYKI
jgi:hypothetical protein